MISLEAIVAAEACTNCGHVGYVSVPREAPIDSVEPGDILVSGLAHDPGLGVVVKIWPKNVYGLVDWTKLFGSFRPCRKCICVSMQKEQEEGPEQKAWIAVTVLDIFMLASRIQDFLEGSHPHVIGSFRPQTDFPGARRIKASKPTRQKRKASLRDILAAAKIRTSPKSRPETPA